MEAFDYRWGLIHKGRKTVENKELVSKKTSPEKLGGTSYIALEELLLSIMA
jgi:hypothetical protein